MFELSSADWQAIKLSLELAAVTTILLLLLGTPIAWWLARTQSRWRGVVNALVALPLVLPPTVLGFYLLLFMGPNGPLGNLVEWLGWQPLPFSFKGLVVASMVYSLPFVVQPLSDAFAAIGDRPLEVAATLGASAVDQFFSVALPLAKNGLLTAAILGFVHTLGEFGVILMIGGNIPGETRVIAIQVYDQVESLNFENAHGLSLFMLLVAFVSLALIYSLQHRHKVRRGESA